MMNMNIVEMLVGRAVYEVELVPAEDGWTVKWTQNGLTMSATSDTAESALRDAHMMSTVLAEGGAR